MEVGHCVLRSPSRGRAGRRFNLPNLAGPRQSQTRLDAWARSVGRLGRVIQLVLFAWFMQFVWFKRIMG